LPRQCQLQRDPSDYCCYIPVCDWAQTTPAPNQTPVPVATVAPVPGATTVAPAPTPAPAPKCKGHSIYIVQILITQTLKS